MVRKSLIAVLLQALAFVLAIDTFVNGRQWSALAIIVFTWAVLSFWLWRERRR
jgi:hypothetical protein